MSARAIWKAVLSIGEETLPVKLYSAVEDQNIHFHLLHDQDMTRVRQRMANSRTGKTVEYEDRRRGVQVSSDTIVMLDEGDLESLEPEASRDVVIGPFLPPEVINHQWYDRPYYLGPDGNTADYFALVDALNESGTEGIARWVMRGKQYLGALSAQDGYLMLITLRHRGEVIDPDQLNPPAGRSLPEREQKLAQQLVAALTADFDPDDYHDSYREQLSAMIAAKARGDTYEPDEEPHGASDDSVFASLEASLQSIGK